MTKNEIYKMAQKARFYVKNDEVYSPSNQANHELTEHLERFAILVAKQQREEDAKLVESMTLEWPDQPEFAQVEGATIADCALIIRQRAITYD